ncbi:hypothetical protein, partial [Aeromonas finlandensis]|uniref:hypothetical protein n=1 Tax=Aeromonas finlandensis TaxID=1543375 RepID=UPI0019D3AE5C
DDSERDTPCSAGCSSIMKEVKFRWVDRYLIHFTISEIFPIALWLPLFIITVSSPLFAGTYGPPAPQWPILREIKRGPVKPIESNTKRRGHPMGGLSLLIVTMDRDQSLNQLAAPYQDCSKRRAAWGRLFA